MLSKAPYFKDNASGQRAYETNSLQAISSHTLAASPSQARSWTCIERQEGLAVSACSVLLPLHTR